MAAIGLDRHTKGLVGFHRATTANDTTQATGRGVAVVWNTIIIGIMIGSVTFTTMTDTTIMTKGTIVTANEIIDS
jgi:hypothetical protein